MAKTTTTKRRPRRSTRSQKQVRMVFERHNYVLLAIGFGLIVIGFTIMRLENEVDGFLSLYVSPLIILAGVAGVIYAILWEPKESRKAPAQETHAAPLKG